MDIAAYLRVDPQSPLPLAAQLVSQITWLIARGEIAEGDRLPPLRALSDHLGINLNTVRAAYKQLEAERLVISERGRGTTVLAYRRDRPGLAYTEVRTFTIGVIIPSHQAFYAPFLNALDSSSTDPTLKFVCVAHDDPLRGLGYLDQLSAKNVDGIVVAGAMIPPDTRIDPHIPIVFADYPGAPGPTVLFDHEKGCALATAHLIEHGHSKIAFIAPPRDVPNVTAKYIGYERSLADAGIPFDRSLVKATPDFDIHSGLAAMHELLAREATPTAVVTASDSLAIGALRAAREVGLNIPEHLALIGSDDMNSSRDLDPPLTSVHAPAAEMGVQVIGMLECLIAGEQTLESDTVTLESHLVIRRSCGCGS